MFQRILVPVDGSATELVPTAAPTSAAAEAGVAAQA